MRSDYWKIFGVIAAASVLFGMAGCKMNEVKADANVPLNGPTTIVINPVSEKDAGTKTPETSAAEPSEASKPGLPESGIINGLYYHLIPSSSSGSGSSDGRGYYIFQDRQDKLSYKILIAAGQFSTGGHDIFISDIQYDGSKITITVQETAPKPTDTVTQAITFPCCAVEIDKLPEKIEVVSKDGAVFEKLDTRLDASAIEKGWIAIIEDGVGEFMRATYVYKTADGKYKYVNCNLVTSSWGSTKWNKTVKDSGIVDTREEVVEAARKFGSCGFVIMAGDMSKPHSVAEFIAGK